MPITCLKMLYGCRNIYVTMNRTAGTLPTSIFEIKSSLALSTHVFLKYPVQNIACCKLFNQLFYFDNMCLFTPVKSFMQASKGPKRKMVIF